ncbi:MAG: 16S rRNA (adenine(1518)-N(6)/adenine(1519)-N(6))-dimethyltransferase RsmA [Parvularculaceae bacterium]|nr:16S rRNA (adenine(1518)-N(6)/adenine(1519)-N(6))-dimethyltransferase RsmA [Parvularculaceae bacterium]
MSGGEPPPLREVIAQFDLGAKKALGQHFLLDLNITRKIARAAEIANGDTAMEIGPGPGGLTRALLDAGASVIAIERDTRCIAALEMLHTSYPDRLTLIEGDALHIDEAAIAPHKPVKIVANLPYNISTELLIKWLRANHAGAPSLWSTMALMFQKEVADRILAKPGTKPYGRLSVISQATSTPARAFDLSARAFTPPPKVESSVVLFRPTAEPIAYFSALERVTQAAFGQRRKMLRSSLKGLFGNNLADNLSAAGVQETQRAEELTLDQFKALAQAFNGSNSPR